MYDSKQIFRVFRYFLWINGLLVIALATGFWEMLPGISAIRAVSISVIVLSVVLYTLGESPLFPYICDLPFVWRIFPNINGDYHVEISSNWALIKARSEHRGSDSTPETDVPLFRKVGKATICCRFTRIDMRLEMDDEYLTSETIVCSLQRPTGIRYPNLFYVYESQVPIPKSTDSDRHLGAGCLSIPEERRPVALRGNYWTNRNWHKGLNTAGQVLLRRV